MDEIVEEVGIESEKEVSENASDSTEKGFTIDQLIDKNSPLRRTKKHILNDHSLEFPYYIKPPYHILKKKAKVEDAGLFQKFKEIIAKLQLLPSPGTTEDPSGFCDSETSDQHQSTAGSASSLLGNPFFSF
ncbi:unnamed protein product [Vicia faba]|uniref:Uncharacterized protein n=1 Tax=Vicia faba TaxID=3906 RepID=A0AAV0YVD8_VICFA|nr:unnamed protein product [Vicia faba]